LATLDQALLDRTTQAKALRKTRYVRSIHRSVRAAPTAVAEAGPRPQLIAKAETPTPGMSAEPAPAPTPLFAQNDVGARYAERETQAQPQQQFRGGDAIIISAGAIVVVLLIVLLILLLR
jgi:hypothetical protein